MAAPIRVAIIGAGPGGLALFQCLKARGIQSVIYEKTQDARKYGYSIVLTQYSRLLKEMGMPFGSFHARTAVEPKKTADEATAFRAERAKFEEVLRQDCDIRYSHEVKQLSTSPSGIQIAFENGDETSADLVVAADGTHSTVRSLLLPDFQLEVLPFVAFNGKRKLDSGTAGKLRPLFQDSVTSSQQDGDTLVQAYVNDYTSNGGAGISYTYSRPPRGTNDPCYKPNRPKASAREIPNEFFDEIKALNPESGLVSKEPWKTIFNTDIMKQDRLLHWLMRAGLPSQQELETQAKRGIVFIGDALLTSPIIGSRGASVAMEQAVDMAEHIQKGTVIDWVRNTYHDLAKTHKGDIKRLEDLHGAASSPATRAKV